MEIAVTDREAGIALMTGQIVEAWLARQPIMKGAVSGEQLSDVITCVRISLTMPIVSSETNAAGTKPTIRLSPEPMNAKRPTPHPRSRAPGVTTESVTDWGKSNEHAG